MSNDDEIIYLAGIFDGEGCVTVWREKSKNDKHYINPKIAIVMTNKKPIQMFSDIFGGNVSTQINKIPNRKVVYAYSATGKRAKLVLDKIIPYLKVKRQQAEHAVEIVNLKILHKRDVNSNQLDNLFNSIRRLNA